MPFIFLAGETEGGYRRAVFSSYWFAYGGDPAGRSTLCVCSTCSARCAPSDSYDSIRTLVRSPRLRPHTTRDPRIDCRGLRITFAVDTAHGRHLRSLRACTVSRRIYIRVRSYCHADRLLQVLRETNLKDRVHPSPTSLSNHLIYVRYTTY